eukprot:6215055-Lingulodinium_polyedra.AAC.1
MFRPHRAGVEVFSTVGMAQEAVPFSLPWPRHLGMSRCPLAQRSGACFVAAAAPRGRPGWCRTVLRGQS